MRKYLASDYLESKYTSTQEDKNLITYWKLIYQLDGKYNLSGEYNSSLEDYYMEIISLLDLIDFKVELGWKIRENVELLASLTFKYLHTNYYFDIQAEKTVNKLYNIYKEKNSDYLNSAEKQLMLDKEYSFKIRVQDKISRIFAFVEGKEIKVTTEKITDTLGDLFNYCMIYLIWDEKGQPDLFIM